MEEIKQFTLRLMLQRIKIMILNKTKSCKNVFNNLH